jgi:hypothetical protein
MSIVCAELGAKGDELSGGTIRVKPNVELAPHVIGAVSSDLSARMIHVVLNGELT